MSETPANAKDKLTFQKRVISSLIAIPIVAALIWFDTPIPWFTFLAAVWGAGAAYEFYNLVRKAKGLSPLTYFGLVWVVLIIISPHWSALTRFHNLQPESLLLAAAVILPLLISLARPGKEQAFASWAWTLAGIFYIGWLLSYLVALRNLDGGRGWVFLAILCTFASDSCAYLFGRTLGKHKMAPYISPHKTWEGSIAGAAGAVIAATIIAYLFALPVTYWQVIILGFLVSCFGQLGDLIKSLFKRNMEVKDSGRVLPGHGGFMDRMDSIAFAGLTVYFFVVLFIAN